MPHSVDPDLEDHVNAIAANAAAEAEGAYRGPVVAAKDVTRRYGEGETAVDALRGVSLEVSRGKLTAVMGPSGSGKSTLMHILAGLDRPTSGKITVEGTRQPGSKAGDGILEPMRDSVDTLGQTTVMVTHDARAAAIADRILFLDDGLIVRDVGKCDPHEVLAILDELAA